MVEKSSEAKPSSGIKLRKQYFVLSFIVIIACGTTTLNCRIVGTWKVHSIYKDVKEVEKYFPDTVSSIASIFEDIHHNDTISFSEDGRITSNAVHYDMSFLVEISSNIFINSYFNDEIEDGNQGGTMETLKIVYLSCDSLLLERYIGIEKSVPFVYLVK